MGRKYLLFSIILIWFVSWSSAQSNEGTDFWLGFVETFDQGDGTKVVMITSKFTTSGTVSIPLQNFSQNFQVNANEVALINIPATGETLGSEIIRNTGIRVQSQLPVSVYIHQYQKWRSEAAIVLPVSALGHEYYTMTYEGLDGLGTTFPSEFLIIATEDETQLALTLSDTTLEGKNRGDTILVTLDQGEAYQVQSKNGNGGDLTGSRVVSNKKVAVFGGNKWTQVPNGCNARDNLLEQMYPLATWGKQFVTIPNAKVDYDIFRVLAAENGTEIRVDKDDDLMIQLDAGEFEEFRIEGEPALIDSNNPILVGQFNVGHDCSGYELGDPSMVLLNSVEQTRDTVTFYNSPFQNITENYIKIITHTADALTTTLNGQPVENFGVSFLPIGATGEFSYVSIRVDAGAHTITNEGCGVIANAYGYGEAESYSYGGGANFVPVNDGEPNPFPVGGCVNDTLYFDVGLSEDKYFFSWDFGDGTIATGPRPVHIYDEEGNFSVRLTFTERCSGTEERVSQNLQITQQQTIDPEVIQVCEGESLQLSVNNIPDATYEWRGPANFYSEEQAPFIDTVHSGLAGDYQVISTRSGCTNSPAILSVEVITSPKPNLGRDTLICSGEDIIEIDPGSFSQYLWQDNTTDRVFNISRPGLYIVTVEDEFGCKGADTILIEEDCPTQIFVPTAFTPNNDGMNDTFRALSYGLIEFHLQVYNRWGKLVFATRNPEDQWDGHARGGIQVAEGVYTWVVDYKGTRPNGTLFQTRKAGTVTLLR